MEQRIVYHLYNAADPRSTAAAARDCNKPARCRSRATTATNTLGENCIRAQTVGKYLSLIIDGNITTLPSSTAVACKRHQPAGTASIAAASADALRRNTSRVTAARLQNSAVINSNVASITAATATR